MKRSNLKLDADVAVDRSGKLGMSKEEHLKIIEEAQDERFKDIRSLTFGWVEQSDEEGGKKERKLMTYLINGKATFIDKSQELEEVIPEDPYICMVYERPREAFAKILFPEYQIVVPEIAKMNSRRFKPLNISLKVSNK